MNTAIKNLIDIIEEENKKVGNFTGIDSGKDLYDHILAYTAAEYTEEQCQQAYALYALAERTIHYLNNSITSEALLAGTGIAEADAKDILASAQHEYETLGNHDEKELDKLINGTASELAKLVA